MCLYVRDMGPERVRDGREKEETKRETQRERTNTI